MKKQIMFMKLFFFDGVVGKMPLARSIIASLVAYLITILMIGMVQIGLLSSIFAFLFTSRVFYNNESLAKGLSVGNKKQVMYAFCLYGLILFVSKSVLDLLAIIQFELSNLLVSGKFLNVFSSYFADITWSSSIFYTLIFSVCLYVIYFPLNFIQKKGIWTLYLVVASGIWVLPNLLVNLYGIYIYDSEIKGEWSGVFFLFQELKQPVQTGLIIVAFLFLVVSFLVSMKVAYIFNRPSSFLKVNSEKEFHRKSKEELIMKKSKKKKICFVIILLLILIGLREVVAIGIIVMDSADSKSHYEKVAEDLTKDNTYGPMVFEDNVYFPTQDKEYLFDDANNSEVMGYFGFKNEDTKSFLYRSFFSNEVYVDISDESHTSCKMRGCDMGDYVKASELEKNRNYADYNYFTIWEEDWLDQSAYSVDETVGYHEISKEWIAKLENLYGEVNYREQDFKNYDTYYTLGAFKNKNEMNNEFIVTPLCVGCILVKDDKYYYGNMENEITGDLLTELKSL